MARTIAFLALLWVGACGGEPPAGPEAPPADARTGADAAAPPGQTPPAPPAVAIPEDLAALVPDRACGIVFAESMERLDSGGRELKDIFDPENAALERALATWAGVPVRAVSRTRPLALALVAPRVGEELAHPVALVPVDDSAWLAENRTAEPSVEVRAHGGYLLVAERSAGLGECGACGLLAGMPARGLVRARFDLDRMFGGWLDRNAAFMGLTASPEEAELLKLARGWSSALSDVAVSADREGDEVVLTLSVGTTGASPPGDPALLRRMLATIPDSFPFALAASWDLAAAGEALAPLADLVSRLDPASDPARSIRTLRLLGPGFAAALAATPEGLAVLQVQGASEPERALAANLELVRDFARSEGRTLEVGEPEERGGVRVQEVSLRFDRGEAPVGDALAFRAENGAPADPEVRARLASEVESRLDAAGVYASCSWEGERLLVEPYLRTDGEDQVLPIVLRSRSVEFRVAVERTAPSYGSYWRIFRTRLDRGLDDLDERTFGPDELTLPDREAGRYPFGVRWYELNDSMAMRLPGSWVREGWFLCELDGEDLGRADVARYEWDFVPDGEGACTAEVVPEPRAEARFARLTRPREHPVRLMIVVDDRVLHGWKLDGALEGPFRIGGELDSYTAARLEDALRRDGPSVKLRFDGRSLSPAQVAAQKEQGRVLEAFCGGPALRLRLATPPGYLVGALGDAAPDPVAIAAILADSGTSPSPRLEAALRHAGAGAEFMMFAQPDRILSTWADLIARATGAGAAMRIPRWLRESGGEPWLAWGARRESRYEVGLRFDVAWLQRVVTGSRREEAERECETLHVDVVAWMEANEATEPPASMDEFYALEAGETGSGDEESPNPPRFGDDEPGLSSWEGPWERDRRTDPWGNAYTLEPHAALKVRVRSAGPDAVPGNADDVAWPRIDSPLGEVEAGAGRAWLERWRERLVAGDLAFLSASYSSAGAREAAGESWLEMSAPWEALGVDEEAPRALLLGDPQPAEGDHGGAPWTGTLRRLGQRIADGAVALEFVREEVHEERLLVHAVLRLVEDPARQWLVVFPLVRERGELMLGESQDRWQTLYSLLGGG